MNKQWDRITRWIRSIRVPTCPTPFVICFLERSGSTHLCSALNSHPDITCRLEDFDVSHPDATSPATSADNDGELNDPFENWRRQKLRRRLFRFNDVNIESPTSAQVTAHFYDIFSVPSHACGFKFKYPIQFEAYPEVVKEIGRMGNDFRLIVLTRHNLLKQAISRQNMLRIFYNFNGNNLHSHQRSEVKRSLLRQPFSLDIQRATKYALDLQNTRDELFEFAEVIEAKRPNTVLRVEYEDLLSKEADTMKKLFEFLSVDSKISHSSYVEKATPDRLQDAICNYDQLVESITSTSLEQFLDN